MKTLLHNAVPVIKLELLQSRCLMTHWKRLHFLLSETVAASNRMWGSRQFSLTVKPSGVEQWLKTQHLTLTTKLCSGERYNTVAPKFYSESQNLSSMQQLCSCLYGSNMNALVKTQNIESNVTSCTNPYCIHIQYKDSSEQTPRPYKWKVTSVHLNSVTFTRSGAIHVTHFRTKILRWSLRMAHGAETRWAVKVF
jgi:hypothetical protein